MEKARKFPIRKLAAILVIAAVLSVSFVFSGGGGRGFSAVGATAYERLDGVALAEQITAEGMVLVKNDGALPLSKTAVPQVNVFGWSSTQWVSSGSGSGQSLSTGRVTAARVGILEALTAYGILYNAELEAMYKEFQGRPEERSKTNNFDHKPYELCRLYEPDIGSTAHYTDAIKDNALAFSDTAIVVIGRITGETFDAPKVQYKGRKTGAEAQTPDDATRSYLEISTEEEALLTYVGANYANVIVVVNAVNVMELGFMDTISGLDACIVAGGTGADGAGSIPPMLYGEVNPSGRLTDIYAYKLNTNANYYTAGADGVGSYENSAGKGLYPTAPTYALNSNPVAGGKDELTYVDYVENIYVGYKWYETADTEGYWANKSFLGKSGYDAVVQYPFGYGLSYTSFSQEIIKISPARNAQLPKDGTVAIEVQVKNTGAIAGKEVVQLYYTPPYTKNGIEKSSSNLCAFEKTKLLAPGEMQTVTLTFAVEDMASYDCYDRNGNGFRGWELEAGEYVVKLMKNSHALSSVVGAEGASVSFFIKSDIRYETDSHSGNKVENRFTGTTAEAGIPCDGSLESTPVKYLSRGDFAATITQNTVVNRTLTQEVEDLNWFTTERAEQWDAQVGGDMPATGAAQALKITDAAVTARGGTGSSNVNHNVFVSAQLTETGIRLAQDFNDPLWEELLNQLTTTELNEVPLMGARRTPEIPSIGKPATKDPNGPIQLNGWGNSDPLGTGFPVTTVLAQTWNKQLCYDFGNGWGTEARTNGSNAEGWYGPSINMHRSAFNGRNYEYYSEDAYLTGMMVSYTVAGAKDAQVHAYLKHLVIYDTETNRDGLYTWLTEQALREIYLKPFKMAIQDGNCTGIMTAYNRIGGLWTGGSPALLTDIVRNEYGFTGAMVTDWPDYPTFMNIDEALRAGGDLWLAQYGGANVTQYQYGSRNSAAFVNAQRRAAKCITFMYLDTKFNYMQFNDGFPLAKAEAKAAISTYKNQYQYKSASRASEIAATYGTRIDSANNLLEIDRYVAAAKAELYGASNALRTGGSGCGGGCASQNTTGSLLPLGLILPAGILFVKPKKDDDNSNSNNESDTN